MYLTSFALFMFVFVLSFFTLFAHKLNAKTKCNQMQPPARTESTSLRSWCQFRWTNEADESTTSESALESLENHCHRLVESDPQERLTRATH